MEKMLEDRYRVAPGPLFGAVHLALAPRYRRIEDAFVAMGEGVVVAPCGVEVVAFHEKHLPAIERLTESP